MTLVLCGALVDLDQVGTLALSAGRGSCRVEAIMIMSGRTVLVAPALVRDPLPRTLVAALRASDLS